MAKWSREYRDRVNRAARFHPKKPTEPETLPALEVGGVLVFAYLHPDGSFRVSVDLDTTYQRLTAPTAQGRVVPITITVQGEVVFAA